MPGIKIILRTFKYLSICLKASMGDCVSFLKEIEKKKTQMKGTDAKIRTRIALMSEISNSDSTPQSTLNEWPFVSN